MKYLEIVFHDNDFSHGFCTALKKLFVFCRSKYDCIATEYTRINMYEAFRKMHEANVLIPLIKTLAVASHIEWGAESVTRWAKVEDDEFCNNELKNFAGGEYAPVDVEVFTKSIADDFNYFNFEIKFHETGEFAEEWKNSEHCALDLESGQVWSF